MHRRQLLRGLAALALAGCSGRPGTPRAASPGPEGPGALTTPAPAPRSPTAQPPGTAPPSPGPTPPPPPSPAPAVRTAVSRELLGLEPAAPGGRSHDVTGLMLHHTAAPTVPAAEAPARFRGHARAHRDAGFVDVAYHWGVDVDGTVYELRDESLAGETFTDYDPAGWFLVVCEGNFEESVPTSAMLDAVADVLAAGAARHGVDPATLVGHRDRAATACPGDNLQGRLDELVGMVRARLDAGGVRLEVTDDPAALPA